MKQFITLLFILFAYSGFSQKYKGDSWAKVKSSGAGTLTVVYYEQPGLIQDVDGKPKGVCVDIITDFVNYVQTKHGKKITVQYAGKEPVFTDFLNAAQNTPNILGVTNVTITEERKKILKFTPSFMSNPVVLLTHKDAPTLTGLSQLSEKYVGYSAEIIAGSTHVKHMDRIKKEYLPNVKITYGPSGAEILKKVTANPKLFTILDFTEYIDATRKQLPIARQNVDLGGAEELGFIMSKQSDWDEIWKEFLTVDYKKSVKYRKIIADNLGAQFLSILK